MPKTFQLWASELTYEWNDNWMSPFHIYIQIFIYFSLHNRWSFQMLVNSGNKRNFYYFNSCHLVEIEKSGIKRLRNQVILKIIRLHQKQSFTRSIKKISDKIKFPWNQTKALNVIFQRIRYLIKWWRYKWKILKNKNRKTFGSKRRLLSFIIVYLRIPRYIFEQSLYYKLRKQTHLI